MKFFRRVVGKCCHVFCANVARCCALRGKILMLHWVGDQIQDDETEPFRIPVERFKAFVEWLKTQNVIRLERWENEKGFYALTIDDVPENFYHNAYPLLKEKDIPFTLFVNVSLLDRKGYITTAQLKEMAQCPLCTVGSHGVNHEEFAMLSKAEARKDLEDSKTFIENLLERPVEIYAFPYGSYYACGYANKHLAGIVYKYAFGTVACSVTKPMLLRHYFLPRINVDGKLIDSLWQKR